LQKPCDKGFRRRSHPGPLHQVRRPTSPCGRGRVSLTWHMWGKSAFLGYLASTNGRNCHTKKSPHAATIGGMHSAVFIFTPTYTPTSAHGTWHMGGNSTLLGYLASTNGRNCQKKKPTRGCHRRHAQCRVHIHTNLYTYTRIWHMAHGGQFYGRSLGLGYLASTKMTVTARKK
jgi:hypothetical protein